MKIKIIGLILVITAIIGLSVLSAAKNGGLQTIKMEKINETEEFPSYRSGLLDNYQTISNIWWETGKAEAPTRAEAVKLKRGFVDLNNLRQWAGNLGLKYDEVKSKERGGEIWSNGKRQLSYSPQTRKFEYGESIESRSQLLGNSVPVETIKDNLTKLLAEIEGVKTLPIVVVEVIPRKLVYPRWVTVAEADADAFEIRANYKVNGVEVNFEGGESIKSVWSKSGKPVKLVTVLPIETAEKKTVETVNLSTIQGLVSAGKVKLWQIRGGEKTDLSYDTQTINRAVNEISLVYIYDEKNSWLMPYYKLVGNAIANNEPVRIEFVAEAGN